MGIAALTGSYKVCSTSYLAHIAKMDVLSPKSVVCCLILYFCLTAGQHCDECDESTCDVSYCGSVAYDTKRYFCRNGKVTGYHVETCSPCRSVIVHLFSWKWTDIARECETFLGPNHFCGVQVSPPNEHAIIEENVRKRPWWERYQPISYKLESRSGNETQFIDMVQRCNAVNVRIYVDVVINHMCGHGLGSGTGSAGSAFNSHQLQFSGVPYGPNDFNCCNCGHCTTSTCDIVSYSNAQQVRNCRLVSLLDLKLSSGYVRGKIISYLNTLVNIGVAGFRVDAAKHMWPGDLQLIYDNINNLSTVAGFAPCTRPFIYSEVIDLGGEGISSSEYMDLGIVTEFRYGLELGRAFRRHFPLSNLQQFASTQWLPSGRALVFVDNHDNQRGHGSGGADILSFYNGRRYKLATVFALAHPYGFARIMSSYRWTHGPYSNDWVGPPHTWDWSISDVLINEATQQCLGDWVCEHRWPLITAMVRWRSVAADTPLRHWWDDGQRQIAFARDGKAFLTINDDQQKSMNVQLQTGLPAGVYCDVASGALTQNGLQCTGRSVTVCGDGRATISIPAESDDNSGLDPVIAIHVGAVQPATTPTPCCTVPPTSTTPSGWQRTIVFMEFHSVIGQHVFIRGGRPQCSADCSIPIRHRLGTTPNTAHYSGYRSWAVGDTLLDWYGAEPGQGNVDGRAASGSPAVWTTNDQSNTAAYHHLNKYGAHHWMLDVDMNCNDTDSGWFELKAYVTDASGTGTWERDVTQGCKCYGCVGGNRPYASANHAARCGFINTLVFEHGACVIDPLLPTMRRTVVFMKFQSVVGQHVSIRGGISHNRRTQCHAAPCDCKIPIRHRLETTPNTAHYSEYRSWAVGDTLLDWNGAQPGQGNGAAGSPAVWTTNDQSNTAAYHHLNKYGEHYWLLDVDMDCCATESGWFELKAYVTYANGAGAWEQDITQAAQCSGSAGGNRPYDSTNHFARCGFVNVFEHGQGSCTIDSF